jgi:hypothetical protein
LEITNARAYAGAVVSVLNTYNTGLSVGPVDIGVIDADGYYTNTSLTSWGLGIITSVCTVYLNGVNFRTFGYCSGEIIISLPATPTALMIEGDVTGTAMLTGGGVTLNTKNSGPKVDFFPRQAPTGTVITTTITGATEYVGMEVTVFNLYQPSGILAGPNTLGIIEPDGTLVNQSVTAWDTGQGVVSAIELVYLAGRHIGTVIYTSVM